MSENILSPEQEIIAGQQGTNDDYKTQQVMGDFNPQTQGKIKQLDKLEAGQEGLIISVTAKTSEKSQSLMSMGISPYVGVRMINNYPRHIIFKIGRRKFAADKEIGAMILVAPV